MTPPDTAGRVVLVHGLWYGAPGMAVMAARLRRLDWSVSVFSYPSVARRFEASVRALGRFVHQVESRQVHLVGHSLGGLLILRLLQRDSATPPGRVVLVGTPVHGSRTARRLRGWPLLGRLLGNSAVPLSRGLDRAPARHPVGVIAGRLPVGASLVAGDLPRPNDGTVSVAETRLTGAADHLELPVSHTGLVLSPRVVRAIDRFLRCGSF